MELDGSINVIDLSSFDSLFESKHDWLLQSIVIETEISQFIKKKEQKTSI